jgi:hypothetical protein
MRETGQLDTQIYPRIKEDMSSVKKNEIAAAARPFPAKQEDIKYPEPALKVGNPLYMTGNMTYGNQIPSQMDMPTKYFPRPVAFTDTFLGGQF